MFKILTFSVCTINPIALRTAKTLWSFGHSECHRINILDTAYGDLNYHCDSPENNTIWIYNAVIRLIDADGIANSVDPDQTALLRAV